MTRDELQKRIDDVIAKCIRNDYAFGSYAHKVTEVVWPVLEAAEKERDALRAKITEMEKQEPAGWQRLYEDGSSTEDIVDSPNVFAHQRPLYALPGAQGE